MSTSTVTSTFPERKRSPLPERLGENAKTGKEIRLAARAGLLTIPTSGLAPSYLQANLIVLPAHYASDFRSLCARNPVPCPLIGSSIKTGSRDFIESKIPGIAGNALLKDCDLRRDVPRYNVYKDSKLVQNGCFTIEDYWTDDHVAFLIGCSFSFEQALTEAGLIPTHTLLNRNVPMYRTTIPLVPSGIFTDSTYIVSMRSYSSSDIQHVRSITRPFLATHGEPIAWGWDAVAKLGIKDIDAPEWGDAPLTRDRRRFGQMIGGDEVPVFWGCGVTPQEAVMRAGLKGTVMSHAPGYMLLLDCKDHEIVN